MNGVHDMGGMDGFGPVLAEANEKVFHAAWEARLYAMHRALAFAGLWRIDDSRAAQEHLPPADYLAASYYKRWTMGFESLLLGHGLVSAAELETGHAQGAPAPLPRRLTPERIVMRRASYTRPATAPPRFAVGERVRTRNMHPHGHTRLPRYARDKTGVIERVQGCHVFPDAVVRGAEDPQWLYTLVFRGPDLWGADSDPALSVSIEAFEPYLEKLA